MLGPLDLQACPRKVAAEWLERFAELSGIERRLLLAGSDGEGSHLRRRRAELLSAIREWNLRFVGGGWSIKKLHKLILLSATWQQSSRCSTCL